MSSSTSHEQQALDAVVARAAVDRAFRQQLLTDPRRAIRDAFSVHIPAGFRIKFVERDTDIDALIVLPDLEDSERSLTEDELEVVSGGGDNAHMAWKRGVPKRPPTPGAMKF